MPERSPAGPPGVAAARNAFFVLGSLGLVVAALYWGQRIFVPLALAVLLTLLLAPVVSRLERRGLKRFPAVLSVACLAFLLIGLAGWAVAAHVAGLLADLPRYKTEFREKVARLRGAGGHSPLGEVQELVDEIEGPGGPAGGQQRPLSALFREVPARALGAASAAGAVVLLAVPLLLYREDTRNRVIRLAGRGRLALTTRALDEAGRRIGGYLLGHSAVNAGFGVAVGAGLAAAGVPYPALWGVLAGAFRFVPSIGVWVVAPLPAVLAFITGPGLVSPALVFVLFLVLELLTANVVEPRVCGRSVGLAPVPLFLAVTFWTGLWGVAGFVLATPVTVCLAVLGKHVPQLGFLAVLLSREAALRPAARYYQRLLARDRHEAEAVVQEYLADHPVEELFDRVLLPALVLLRRGRKAGVLRAEDEELILPTTREVVDGLRAAVPAGTNSAPTGRALVLGIPAADRVDEVALLLLSHLAWPAGPDVQIAGGSGASGVAALGQEVTPAAILIAAVGPGGLTEARYLCRRLRAQYPGVKVLVGRWGQGKDPKKARAILLSAGADHVAATLLEARVQLRRLLHPAPPVPDAPRAI